MRRKLTRGKARPNRGVLCEACPLANSDEELRILTAVLDQARETLLVGIRGTPEDLSRSLGKLNLACKAHWDWQTIRRGKNE